MPSTREKKTDLHDKTIIFSNNELFSDHEEADTKLVALVQAADVAPGEAVMVRSSSEDRHSGSVLRT